MDLELAVIVPTYNERENIPVLLSRITDVLSHSSWEVIVVDDNSPDGTADFVRGASKDNPKIRCIQRIGRRGLSSACIEGMLSTHARFLAVIDADLQHDESLLQQMLNKLRQTDVELVIGVRTNIGEKDSALSKVRAFLSQLGNLIANLSGPSVFADPMSGFFMIRRSLFEECVSQLSGRGFKILLDIVFSCQREISFAELPYKFRPRASGVSKLDTHILHEHFLLVLSKTLGQIIPVEFILFVSSGIAGACLHLTMLCILFRLDIASFVLSQLIASLVAMNLNYLVNNRLTYRNHRLREQQWWTGLIYFILACTPGLLANLSVANQLYSFGTAWWIAGLAGGVVGSVWNYGATKFLVWQKP